LRWTCSLIWGANVQFIFVNHILDIDRRELRCGSTLIAIEPQVFDLLVHLVQNRDRVVSKDDLIASVWGGRIVSDSALNSRINAARKAVGDNGESQKLIRTIARKGFRFVGEVSENARPISAGTAADISMRAAAAPHQVTHFCTTPDGVHIAHAEVGTGPTLVKAANYLSHLEYDWQSPVWSPFLHALANRYHVIRYDARGNGLSDWDVENFSFEAFIRDLETVIDATNLQRFALLGMSQGCAISVAYAVRHPEHVSHLVLYGGYVRGRRLRSIKDAEQAEALLTLMRDGWGQDNPAFRQIFTSLFIPGGSPEQMNWWNDLQRKTTSPENAVSMRRAWDNIDISDLLPRVQVPTLVLHCRDDAVQPFDEGRRLAAGIPDARFVELEGRNHVILQSDPSWSRFFEEIGNFLQN
jgi:pimeloyl-ACP methyl ester carboxylesterase/DNA-binding winged helix-turn-helix (wHTH) protein